MWLSVVDLFIYLKNVDQAKKPRVCGNKSMEKIITFPEQRYKPQKITNKALDIWVNCCTKDSANDAGGPGMFCAVVKNKPGPAHFLKRQPFTCASTGLLKLTHRKSLAICNIVNLEPRQRHRNQISREITVLLELHSAPVWCSWEVFQWFAAQYLTFFHTHIHLQQTYN